MVSKILMGVSAAMGLALAVVFWLLLGAKEANGKLQEGISTAKDINTRQALAMDAVQANHDNLLLQMEQERVRTEAANLALDQVQSDFVAERLDFKRRLNDALNELTDEELTCAAEFVPQPIIDSLHDEPSGPVGP